MSTRSEQFRAEAERTAAASPRKPNDAEPNGAAAKKATYARERQAEHGQPSRRSTRKSANGAKTDIGKVRTEQMQNDTADARFARSRAKGHRAGESA